MEFNERVSQLLKDFLDQRPDLFLIDLRISLDSNISVILDGDNGVSLQDCLDASRAIENNLDRDEHDFALSVSSAGLSEPLATQRQFRKNIGRNLDLTMQNDLKLNAELLEASEDGIVVSWTSRKPKEIGKGKVDVVEVREIPYSEIKKALVEIKF